MEKKINIAELLKDCPTGMELDCTIFENIEFDHIDEDNAMYSIICRVKTEWGGYNVHTFTEHGCYSTEKYSKCAIFPKGKTTWEGFVPPCKFKSGDVLVSESGNIVLLSHIDSENIVHYHCIIPTYGSFRIEENTNVGVGRYYDCVLANEQQKQRMYDKIKCSGYKYNQHINKLEKLVEPRFKVGDRVKTINKLCQYDITELTDTHYTLVEVEGKFKYTEPIIEDKNWELVPNKFNITTLKPFDKVLVRGSDKQSWYISFFSHCNKLETYKYSCINGVSCAQCIPYEGNEHLLDTTNDCDEFYKTWE